MLSVPRLFNVLQLTFKCPYLSSHLRAFFQNSEGHFASSGSRQEVPGNESTPRTRSSPHAVTLRSWSMDTSSLPFDVMILGCCFMPFPQLSLSGLSSIAPCNNWFNNILCMGCCSLPI